MWGTTGRLRPLVDVQASRAPLKHVRPGTCPAGKFHKTSTLRLGSACQVTNKCGTWCCTACTKYSCFLGVMISLTTVWWIVALSKRCLQNAPHGVYGSRGEKKAVSTLDFCLSKSQTRAVDRACQYCYLPQSQTPVVPDEEDACGCRYQRKYVGT